MRSKNRSRCPRQAPSYRPARGPCVQSSCLPRFHEQRLRVARDHQLLVRGNRPRGDAARSGAYAWTAGVVRCPIELHPEPPRIPAHALAQRRAVLADSRSEHDRIESTQRRGERTQLAADAIDVEIDCSFCTRLVARKERAHVARYSGNAKKTRLLIDQLL